MSFRRIARHAWLVSHDFSTIPKTDASRNPFRRRCSGNGSDQNSRRRGLPPGSDDRTKFPQMTSLYPKSRLGFNRFEERSPTLQSVAQQSARFRLVSSGQSSPIHNAARWDGAVGAGRKGIVHAIFSADFLISPVAGAPGKGSARPRTSGCACHCAGGHKRITGCLPVQPNHSARAPINNRRPAGVTRTRIGSVWDCV